MQAALIPVVRYHEFNASMVGAGATSTDLVLARDIAVIPFWNLRLLVRVHEVQVGSGQSVEIKVFNVFPSDADGQEFRDDTARLTQTVSDTTTAGRVLAASTNDWGPFVQVVATLNQSMGGPGPFRARLSVDLLGRCCG